MVIRKAEKTDMKGVMELIRELAMYEKAPDEVEVTEADLIADGFGDNKVFSCFVAANDREIMGMGLYYFKYSTWKGKCVYLEDLIVKEKHRGRKIGARLFEAIARECKELGVKRMEWQVLDWNEPAIRFYEALGATRKSEWVGYRLSGEALLNLAQV